MKKLAIVIIVFTTLMGCKGEPPLKFSEAALQDDLLTTNDVNISFKEILEQYPNQSIVIDFWASWCGDCIKGLPKVKALQQQFPEATFIFLSVDRDKGRWLRAINKYDIQGDHYFLPKGMKKGDLVDFIDLGWIPRYMVVDSQGNIKVFDVIKADDQELIQALT